MRDAERLQIGDNRRSGVEVKVGRQLDAVGGDWNGRRHYCCPIRQNTDHGGMTSLVSPPQIGLPVASLCSRAISLFDKLAMSSSRAPSPMRQLAVSKPLFSACAAPKAAPASRGTISRRRIASSCCTSASRFLPAGLSGECQPTPADANLASPSGSGISSPYFA